MARGEGPVEPGVPANATPTPESYDPGYRDGPSRRDGRGGGAPMPDFGGGAPGGESVPAPGGGSVPDLGGGESVPAPGGGVPMPDFGGGDAGPTRAAPNLLPDTTERGDDMSVAGASLVVAIGLTALACANWLWLRLDPKASASHLPALADVALVALALHALALVATGTTSPAEYGLTIVLACAAAAVRRPSAMAASHR